MGLIKAIAVGVISMLLVESATVSDITNVKHNATESIAFGRSVSDTDLFARGSWEISEEYYADYDSIDFVGSKGTPWSLRLTDDSIEVDIPQGVYADIAVFDDKDKLIVEEDGEDASFPIDIADYLETDECYWIAALVDIDNAESEYVDIYFTKDKHDKLVYLKSPVYDFNVEQFSVLREDEQSLKENLAEQHDIMWDNPELIAIAEKVTAGAKTDYDKALAIYKFIVDEFYYDNTQLLSYDVVQDDIMILVRNKVAVCQGFANVFVGMCRAVGLPAAVVFGYSEDFTNVFFRDNYISNHAWAEVYVGGEWRICDFTWDNFNTFDDGIFEDEESTLDWYLIPLEVFSFTHKILDADTVHSLERSGSCGDNATYSISRDGVLTVSGSGELVLPEGLYDFVSVVFDEDSCITSIGNQCFMDCDLLEAVILPDTLQTIGDEAFYTCEALEYLYIPEGVTSIGTDAFLYCDELAYLRIPDSVTQLNAAAFEGCPHLVISLPKNLKNMYFEGNVVKPLSVIFRDK